MLSAGLTFESAVDARAAAGLIGPNAVIQLAAALRNASGSKDAAPRVFASAGVLHLLQVPPDAMIDEAIPARLFEALWRELGPTQAAHIAHDAGRRTGAYVLDNRIPKIARAVFRVLPQHLAATLLLKAIRRNAWTFAGSGTCRIAPGNPAMLTISRNPLAMPDCVWHVGVFEHLFRALVSRQARVRHVDGWMDGAPASRFEIEVAAT